MFEAISEGKLIIPPADRFEHAKCIEKCRVSLRRLRPRYRHRRINNEASEALYILQNSVAGVYLALKGKREKLPFECAEYLALCACINSILSTLP